MTDEMKLAALESRLKVLTARGAENNGVCRRINREIRNIRKKTQKDVK